MPSRMRFVEVVARSVIPPSGECDIPERNLLRAILLRAIIDAVAPVRVHVNDNIERDQRGAEEWILDTSEHKWSCRWILSHLVSEPDGIHERLCVMIQEREELVENLRAAGEITQARGKVRGGKKSLSCEGSIFYGNIQTGKCVLSPVSEFGAGSRVLQ